MKRILAFAASNSRNSINRVLAKHTADIIGNYDVRLLDLNEYEMPIYSVDRERESGIHELAQRFFEEIQSCDGIIISFAEHNGSFSAAYKNIYDWVSRIDMNVWQNKPMFLLATSPGKLGGKNVLNSAYSIYSYSNSNTIIKFSLPSFSSNFDNGIVDDELKAEYLRGVSIFREVLG